MYNNASAWIELPRSAWAELAGYTNVQLNQSTLDKLRGLGDPTNEADVQEVYLPLTQLMGHHVRNMGNLYRDTNAYLGLEEGRTPFVVAIAGSVAVGKSTVARLVAELLRRTLPRRKVQLITTDGFLYPNSVLEERGILSRKGFPESFDAKRLMQFVLDVKSGLPLVTAPVYSHTQYDVVPGEFTVVESPDILVIEGLNVLQPARRRDDGQPALAVSDFIDFSVYVDADQEEIRNWYISRFLKLRDSAFQHPESYFARYARLSDAQAIMIANRLWDEVNGPNLMDNIRPTAERATAILRKGGDHTIESVRIRKI